MPKMRLVFAHKTEESTPGKQTFMGKSGPHNHPGGSCRSNNVHTEVVDGSKVFVGIENVAAESKPMEAISCFDIGLRAG